MVGKKTPRADPDRMHAPPPLRHCPICRVAMQAGKTREDSPHFDRFDCLSCNSVIEKPPTPRQKPTRR